MSYSQPDQLDVDHVQDLMLDANDFLKQGRLDDAHEELKAATHDLGVLKRQEAADVDE